MNKDAAEGKRRIIRREGKRRQGKGPPANYPAPSLYGSPFTTLAVTQNYLSYLHCEPCEHPFSYITWLDVLSSGSSMEVRRGIMLLLGIYCWQS